jgi:hypothetical protein
VAVVSSPSSAGQRTRMASSLVRGGFCYRLLGNDSTFWAGSSRFPAEISNPPRKSTLVTHISPAKWLLSKCLRKSAADPRQSTDFTLSSFERRTQRSGAKDLDRTLASEI